MATVKTPSEQRVVLHNIGWATYERLLADNENNSAPRLAYDRGELEIVSPSPEHEKFNRRIAQLVLAVAEELGLADAQVCGVGWGFDFFGVLRVVQGVLDCLPGRHRPAFRPRRRP
jgi:Uma2 family endonuclease